MAKAPRSKSPGKKPARRKSRAAKRAGAGEAPPARPVSSLLRQKGEGSFRSSYLRAIKLGLKKDHCARLAGCDPSTIREWEALALEDEAAGRESEYREFFAEVSATQAELMMACMATVQSARVRGDWHAARWLLELNGYRRPVEVTGVEGSAIPIVVLDAQDMQELEDS